MAIPQKKTTFCLAGVTGKMGREVLKSLPQWQGIELVSAIARAGSGNDLSQFPISSDLSNELKSKKPDVLVELTHPGVALKHALLALEHGVAPIIGTSGLSPQDFAQLENASERYKTPSMVIPNFSVGAVLGMKFAQLAAQWISDVEIIELHHDQKLDAPSGTAIETARLIQQSKKEKSSTPETKFLKIEGVRGGKSCDIPIHSVRLKGVLAQQSVIFGAPGETLEIKHTVIDRSTYMKGIELCIRKIRSSQGLTIGLESILFA